MSVLLGCIGDDFTGSTDLAGFLVASGMRTIQLTGLPKEKIDLSGVDAVVISLKSRTQETSAAVADSLSALRWLQSYDCRQYYFKYCSTFDSTEKGNIGPVADALLDALKEGFTIACPSLPVNGRTVYNGYLFVNGVLLNESGMQHHPLTPMKDANLVRVLGRQTRGKVGLVDQATVSMGAEAIRKRYAELAESHRYAVVDTLFTKDLIEIGHASAELKLLTGGSGLAIGLADNFEKKGLFAKGPNAAQLDRVEGDALILSGSCSSATLEQVAVFKAGHPALQLDPLALHRGSQTLDQVMHWFETHRHRGPLMIYATDRPETIRRCQEELGIEQAGTIVERMFAEIARAASTLGVTRFIVAGGETSGAVVQALGIKAIKIGPPIAPGVPVTQALGDRPLLLALKSGNFGDRDFFAKALVMMR
ncbi:MAG: four-carbon acid sugar kinase family protein [Deltaproteobacteria bacterium]|nr:four-carbon acid sugar kinase family protein [Deltaproteobacteria bacterium]